MLDVISIGDVTEDVFVNVGKVASTNCNDSGRSCTLAFSFPTKLPILKVDKLIGGNAGNMAIGASRLGLKSALYSEVGLDTQGTKLKQSLKDNNVSTKYFYQKSGEKTNYSVVLYYKGDRTILVHHEKRKYQFPKLAKSKWVYLTSMAHGSERIFAPLKRYLKGTNMGFNPGSYQLRLGLKKLTPILKVSTYVCLNTQEAQKLLKTKKRDFRYLARKMQETGPKIAIITDGGNGAYCYDGEKHYFCPIYGVPIMERTGCGDAFSTGFLSALAYGKTVPEALAWGTVNSAGVIQQVGPQNGLVKKSLLTKILKANPLFKAKEYIAKEVTKGRIYKPKKFTHF